MAIEQKSHQDQPLPRMNPNPNSEYIGHEESEDEDTLSLCDLPIRSGNSTADDHYQDSSMSSSSDGQEFFGFFSEEWKDSNTTPINIFSSNPVVPQDVIFGGKQIPSHKPISKSKSQEKPSIKKSISMFVKSKSTSSSSRSKRSSSGEKGSDKNEVLVPKVSPAPVKAKLLLVLFGLPPKIPTDQMELKNDIRNRQSRHAPSTFFPSNGGGSGGGEEVATVHRRSEKGLWRLSKAALCFGGPADMKTNEDF